MIRKGRKVTETKNEIFFLCYETEKSFFSLGLIKFNYTLFMLKKKICKILWRTISVLFTRAKVYSEPSETSKMELLCENSSRL